MRLPALVLLGLSAAAASCAAQHPPVRLSDDARLQHGLTKDFGVISFKDLCKELSKATGVGITAGNRTMNDMVILVVKDKTCADVMAKIANQFGFEWESRGEAPHYAYVLSQSSDSMAQEAKRRKQLEMEELQKVRNAIAKQAKTTQAEVDETAKKIRRWYEAEPTMDWEKINKVHAEQSDWQETPEEIVHRKWEEQRPAGVDKLNPCARAVNRFLAGLDEASWQRLAGGASITFCTAPRPYQSRLPFDWLPLMRSWMAWDPGVDKPEGAPASGQGPSKPDAATQRQAEIEARMNSDLRPPLMSASPGQPNPLQWAGRLAIVTMILDFTEMRFGDRGMGGLTVTVIAMDSLRRRLASTEVQLNGGDEAREPGSERGSKPPDYSKDPVLGKTVTPPKTAFAAGNVSPDEMQAIKQYLLDIDKQDPLSRSQAALLQAIAVASGQSVIADAYDRNIAPFAELMGMEERTSGMLVGQQLDGLHNRLDQSWKLADGWIGVKSRRAAYLRPRQMSRDIVRALLRLMLGKEEATLDVLLQLATSATELQFDGMLGNTSANPFLGVGAQPLMSRSSRAALRLWADLGAQAQGRLLAGDRVPARVLTQAPRDEFVTAVREYDANAGQGVFGMLGSPDEAPAEAPQPASDLAPLNASPNNEIPTPFDWTEFVPEATPAPISLAVSSKKATEFYVEIGPTDGPALFHMPMSGQVFASSLNMTAEDREQMAAAGMSPKAGREETETLTFQLLLTDNVVLRVAINTSRRVPNSEFDPFKPPDDIKQLIEKYKQPPLGGPEDQPQELPPPDQP